MIWAFCIARDTDTPNPPEGMVQAETEAEAFAVIGDPDTNLYSLPADVPWPGNPNANLWWANR